MQLQNAKPELKLKFRDPLHDSRTPDIIVQPVYGNDLHETHQQQGGRARRVQFRGHQYGIEIVSNPGMDPVS